MPSDEANRMRDDFEPVMLAREQYQRTLLPEDKQRWDAALAAYNSRLDCSVCDTRGLCRCTYTPAPHSDANETVQRFDSGVTTMPIKSYSEHLADCGNALEARARFHADSFESRRPTTVASVRSDSVDDAEAAMRLRGLTAHCTPEGIKAVQRKLAEQASQQADRRNHLASVRADAADGKCKTCEAPLTADDSETCAKCTADNAERGLKTRSANAWRKPLQASKSRMSDPDNGGGAAA